MIPVSANVEPAAIVDVVAKRLKINPDLLREKNREPWRALVRFAIAWVLINQYNWTSTAAAEVIGKERTTVHYGNCVIDALMHEDENTVRSDQNLSKQRDVVLLVSEAIRSYFNTVV